MNILLVSNGFPPSGQWGTEFYTYQLATGLVARGHAVTVFCPERRAGAPRYSTNRSTRYGVTLVEVCNGGDPKKSFRDSYRNEGIEQVFDDLLSETRPDVVHFIHMLWGLSVRLPEIAKARGVRTLATLTDYGLLCHRGQRLNASVGACSGSQPAKCAQCIREPGPWDGNSLTRSVKRAAGRSLAKAASLGLDLGVVVREQDLDQRQDAVRSAMTFVDAWVAPTKALAGPFLESGVDAGRLSVVPYAIDEAPYRSAPARMQADRVRFGFLGQFLPHKGLHVLFDAIRILQHRLPESVEAWDVIVHGNKVGGRNGRYMRSIWSEDLMDRVHIEGPFEPLRAPQVLAGLDAAVLPSLWDENAPLTVLQARAAGVPIIASDVPGVREVVEQGRGAQLFPPGDAAALAASMRALILDPPLRDPDRSPQPLALDDHLEAIESLYGGLGVCEIHPRRRPSAPASSNGRTERFPLSPTPRTVPQPLA